MKDTVEIPAELAVQVCRALISCVDELTAAHVIKYGHLEGTQNPAVLRKMMQDDKVRSEVRPVLDDLYELLDREGLSILPEQPTTQSK